MCCVINILYVAKFNIEMKKTWMLPVMMLQNVVQKAVTVFFLPITEILVSMVECEPNEKGELILGLYPEIPCFSGMHFVHGGLSLIITIVFVLIALMCSYTLFEN